MNRLKKTESANFLYCRFSVSLKGPFFPDFYRLQKLSLCRMELVNLLPHIDIVLIFFHILVLQKYWALTESRIPLRRIVALSISSH